MTFFSCLMVGMYGRLLRLYPRNFQDEFREEMHGVFASAVKEAVKIGTFPLLRFLFFELLDFPISLAIEHFSQWRKEWSMKDTRHGIRPFRSAEMGAIGLLIGFVIIKLARQYLNPNWWYTADSGKLLITLREVVAFSVASALLGMMLCLSVSAGPRFTLRAFFLVAGLEAAAELLGTTISWLTPYQGFIQSLKGNWQIAFIALANLIFAMIDGLFIGAGLGLALGGWKSCKRFALKGMLAFGAGMTLEQIIHQVWLSSNWIWNTGNPGVKIVFESLISTCIYAIIAGGILGWMWGKDNPVGMPKEKTA